MATYIELRNLFSDNTLHNRIDIAVIVAASNLLAGTPTIDEQRWAAAAFNRPREESQKAYMAVLAVNRGADIEQIQGASDTAIQTNVDAVVPGLVIAFKAAQGV